MRDLDAANRRVRGRVERLVALVAVVALMVAGCTSGGKATGVPSPPSTGSGATVADLTSGGVVVVDSESDVETLAPGSIVVVRAQAERMIAEARGHGGILGADIDALAPLPDGAPPMSYFVAAWISQAGSPGAQTAARWMGQQDWTHASSIVFPMAVVALFSADALGHVDAELPPAAGATSNSAALAMAQTVVPAAFVQEAGGPCSAVTDFLGRTLSAVFDALRISPSSITGLPPVLSATVGFLAGLWNTAVSFAEGVVQGLIKTLTAPIVEALRVGLGALSVATVVVSYLRTWTLTVDLDPQAADTDTYRFAVDAEPDIKGEFVARAPELADDWPAALRDCAEVAGVALPQLLAPGSEATWTVEHNDGVVAIDRLQTPVSGDRTMHLPFTTGRETAEQAKGEPAFGSAIVRVRAPRKELQDFFDFARGQLDGVRDQLLSKVPSADLRAFAKAQIDAIVDPVANQLKADVVDALGSIVTLAGTGVVIVKYHQPPEPSSPPAQPPSGPPSDATGDFCKQLAELVQWSAAHSEEDGSEVEIRRRWVQMKPLAPAALQGDVGLQIQFDDAVIAQDWLTSAAIMRQVGEAQLRIAAACNITMPPNLGK